MSVKSDKLKSGYAELSDSEKAEVRDFIKKYDEAGPLTKSALLEQTRTFSKSAGPRDQNACPCCGKS
jgi:hypothetical protein